MEGMTMDCFLVIPCLRESERVPVFLDSLCREIRESGLSVGVLLVDDGSGQEEVRRLRKVVARVRNSYVWVEEVFSLKENRGKGAAIRSGWALAPDDCRLCGFADADGSVGASEVLRLMKLALQEEGEVLLLASRRAAGARVKRSLGRKFVAASFSAMIRLFYGVRVLDTQCGCKFVTGSWLRTHSVALREDGFGLDLELVLQAGKTGCAVREVGIDWREKSGSKVGVKNCWSLGKAVALRRIGAEQVPKRPSLIK